MKLLDLRLETWKHHEMVPMKALMKERLMLLMTVRLMELLLEHNNHMYVDRILSPFYNL